MATAVITSIALLWVARARTENLLLADRNQARQGFADRDVQPKRCSRPARISPDPVVAKRFGLEPMPFFHSDAREAVRVFL